MPRFPSFQNTVRLFAAMALFALAACSGTNRPQYVERPVDVIYNTAMDALATGDYAKAAREFDEVERQHPYSVWARRATLMSAYNHYLSNDYDSSILASQRFLALHPGNRDAPYAYYLVAISYYEQISDVGRDQKATQQALDALNEVIRRFPGTDYAEDARLKVELTISLPQPEPAFRLDATKHRGHLLESHLRKDLLTGGNRRAIAGIHRRHFTIGTAGGAGAELGDEVPEARVEHPDAARMETGSKP